MCETVTKRNLLTLETEHTKKPNKLHQQTATIQSNISNVSNAKQIDIFNQFNSIISSGTRLLMCCVDPSIENWMRNEKRRLSLRNQLDRMTCDSYQFVNWISTHTLTSHFTYKTEKDLKTTQFIVKRTRKTREQHSENKCFSFGLHH